jgi:glycerol-3-phosphate acyltransferase PlsY
MMDALLWLGIGYLLGAIPFGLILARASGAGDIRTIGSGNIGATNVLRTGKKGVAAATLLLDAGKGFLAVWLAARHGGEWAALAAGLGAFAGHVHPVWLNFRGGKGVATLLGVTLALAWPAGLVFAAAWGGAAWRSKISSLGGMTGGIAAALYLAVTAQWAAAGLVALLSAWVLWTHRANIERIMGGTEPRIGQK